MSTYTIDEVSNHNNENDCWIIINNRVYDITYFLNKHPGGKSILVSVGGSDATEYFEELHREEILEEFGSEYLIGYID